LNVSICLRRSHWNHRNVSRDRRYKALHSSRDIGRLDDVWRQLARVTRNNWLAMLVQMDVDSDRLSRRISLLQLQSLRVLGPLIRLFASFFSTCPARLVHRRRVDMHRRRGAALARLQAARGHRLLVAQILPLGPIHQVLLRPWLSCATRRSPAAASELKALQQPWRAR
jgi:hypothetical protein